MTHADNERSSALDETQLASFGISESGWVEERAAISDATEAAVRGYAGANISDAQFRLFMAALGRGLANAVEMELFLIALRGETEVLAERPGWNRPVPAKLGVLLRDYISNLRLVLEKAEHGERRITVSQFIRDIQRFPVLERLVNLILEERFRLEIIDPLSTAPEKAAELLPDVLRDLEMSIAAGVRRGPTAVSLTYLAEYFVRVYRDFTGSIPGRTWSPYEEIETGKALEICRLLSREFWAALPETDRPEIPANMAKSYRKAIEKLRKEERSKS